MDIVVPFDAREPKTRLSTLLNAEERHEFADAMLKDVCEAIEYTGHEPTILATADIDAEWTVRVDERSLSEAVNAVIAESDGAVAIVMADLALTTPDALERVFDADGEVVLVPGRGGGTNVILARHPEFRVDYHGVSIRDHRETAERIGAQTVTVDSFRLATDVDEPADLVEVILHADTDLAQWLSRHGIEIDTSDDRATCSRRD